MLGKQSLYETIITDNTYLVIMTLVYIPSLFCSNKDKLGQNFISYYKNVIMTSFQRKIVSID